MAHAKNTQDTGIQSSSNDIFANLRDTLPPLLSRKKVGEALQGIISPRTLANLDSTRNGPPRIKVGNKVVYEKEHFFQWLEARTKF